MTWECGLSSSQTREDSSPYPCLLLGIDNGANSSTIDEGIGAWHSPKKTARGFTYGELKSLDVLLPTREKTIRLRMAATPSKELKVLLQRMKIPLPSKLKFIKNVVKKMA